MNIQIFGTKKCKNTQKAERWFKERRIPFQAIDLKQKGMSAGELRSVARHVGGVEALMDREGTRYAKQGLKDRAPTGPRVETALLDDPQLLKTPIVRNGSQAATLGHQPDVWKSWQD
jgi:arsenate reductase